MRETSTQFTARVIGLRAPTVACDEPFCWLCGGGLGGKGLPVHDVIGAAFTDHPKRPNSEFVCLGCAATVSTKEFQRVVTERAMGLKLWAQCGFNNYGHFVAEPGTYECPKPARIREILLDPPAGRWMLAINESGKKHTIAKATVNEDRVAYAVVVADELLWTTRDAFARCLADFERMSELGFTKDEILTGRLQVENLRRAGEPGREAEKVLRTWRLREPHLLALVHHVARSQAFYQEEQKENIA